MESIIILQFQYIWSVSGNPYSIIYPELEKIQKRDKFKQFICEKNGITMIVIPYWWNKSIDTVSYLIHSVRPDISQSNPETMLPLKPKYLLVKGKKFVVLHK